MSDYSSAQVWRAQLRAKPLLNALPVVALIVFGALFLRHVSTLDGPAVWAALGGLALWQWVLALGLTALSFLALGSYDVILHRVLNTGMERRVARFAGIKAIALSQTLGFGIVTSALVRWRCLPDFSAAASLRLSATVSVTFLVALTVVTALVVPFSGLVARSTPIVLSGLIAITALVLLARLAFRLGWIDVAVRRDTMLALLLATAADTIFAAAALWVLWPEAVSFHLLFAAYLVALGAGLLSNAPGGVGAFDLALLAMIPASDDASAMAALLAFRVIYYAIPAGLALIALMRAPHSGAARTTTPLSHPEAALMRQSATQTWFGTTSVLTLPAWGGGAILGDLPKNVDLSCLDGWFTPSALYKCSGRQALRARQAGWAVMRCAEDALIDPQTWTTEGSSRRQLRRALSAFGGTDLTLREVLDMQTLAPVAAQWATQHGGEKGHTMGQFCPDYLSHQRVFAAFNDDGQPVAFVSFHTGAQWTLDLMRHVADLPKGTMQALICAAIAAAKEAGANTLSLASVAAPPDHLPFATKALRETAGLRRFKSAFGPTWHARYFCAPTRAGLVRTAASLWWHIHHPQKVDGTNPVHRDHEDFSFAPPALACDPLASHSGVFPDDQRTRRPSRYT